MKNFFNDLRIDITCQSMFSYPCSLLTIPICSVKASFSINQTTAEDGPDCLNPVTPFWRTYEVMEMADYHPDGHRGTDGVEWFPEFFR